VRDEICVCQTSRFPYLCQHIYNYSSKRGGTLLKEIHSIIYYIPFLLNKRNSILLTQFHIHRCVSDYPNSYIPLYTRYIRRYITLYTGLLYTAYIPGILVIYRYISYIPGILVIFVAYRFYYKCWCAGLRPPTICTKSSLAYNA
jgi:hypothetical protein